MAAWPGWDVQVLRAGGYPVTARNRQFLQQWQSYEQSGALNNPLGTTAYPPVPATVGVSPYNKAGVQNYVGTAQGTQATVAFLQMPNFTDISAALRSGDPYQYTLNHTTLVDQLRKWGSVNFANQIKVGGDQYPGQTQVHQVTGAVSTVGDFLGKLGDPNLWLRIGEVVAGAVLALLGVYLLTRQIGLANPLPNPAGAIA